MPLDCSNPTLPKSVLFLCPLPCRAFTPSVRTFPKRHMTNTFFICLFIYLFIFSTSQLDTCVVLKLVYVSQINCLCEVFFQVGVSDDSGYLHQREREREMFYLTTHSTHFIYGYMASDIWVKDHSDSEKGNPLPPHRLLLSINSKGSFICTIPQTG